jgi:hypothetical protein
MYFLTPLQQQRQNIFAVKGVALKRHANDLRAKVYHGITGLSRKCSTKSVNQNRP